MTAANPYIVGRDVQPHFVLCTYIIYERINKYSATVDIYMSDLD